MSTLVAIVGGGPLAIDVLDIVESRVDADGRQLHRFAGFVRSNGDDQRLRPVLCALDDLGTLAQDNHPPDVVVAVDDGDERCRLGDAAAAAGLRVVSVVDARAIQGADVRIGAGAIVGPGVSMTTNVEIADYALIHPNATIAHDCVIGRGATIGPGANLNGNVRIGTLAVIGSRAVLLPGTHVGDRSVVRPGAVVVADVDEGDDVDGVPARSSPRDP